MDHLRAAWRVSVRRACQVLRADRSTYQYRSQRGSQDELRQRIREIAETRVRYGYRRIHVLLQREGWAVNAKRVYRLYREMGLQLRNKTPKRKVKAKLREGRTDPVMANDVWAMDFVHDQLYDGRRLRILTVIDAEQVRDLERLRDVYRIDAVQPVWTFGELRYSRRAVADGDAPPTPDGTAADRGRRADPGVDEPPH